MTHEKQPRRRQALLSPSQKTLLLDRAFLRGIDHVDIADACGVDTRTVFQWEEAGLFGDLSAREIERLIEESKRRHEKLIADFKAACESAGIRTRGDYRLAGFAVGNDRNDSKLVYPNLTKLRPSHLEKLRAYIAERDAALEAERERERRHFGRRRSIAELIG